MHLFQSLNGPIASGMRLAFDFDNTICDVGQAFRRHIRQVWDERATGVSIDTFFTKGFHIQVPGFSNNQVWKHVIRPGLLETLDCAPEQGAVEFLRFWYAVTGDPILVVTARPDDCMDLVPQWFIRWAKVPAIIVQAKMHADKPEILKEYGVTDFIEDRHRTCRLLAEQGFTVWMIEHPWNTCKDTPEGVFLGNWTNVFDYYYRLYMGHFGIRW